MIAMKELFGILWEWRFVIGVAIAFGAWCILEWEKAKGGLYQLMLLAKGKAKDMILNSGQEQEDWVVEKAWSLLPLKFKIFLNEDTLRKIIRWLYRKAKDKLDNGKLDGSI
jgi:hypothetical protein